MDRHGREQRRTASEYQVSYRRVTGPLQDEWFIGARLKFEHKPGVSETKVRELLEKRKATQPIGEWSCGSVFTNPPAITPRASWRRPV